MCPSRSQEQQLFLSQRHFSHNTHTVTWMEGSKGVRNHLRKVKYALRNMFLGPPGVVKTLFQPPIPTYASGKEDRSTNSWRILTLTYYGPLSRSNFVGC